MKKTVSILLVAIVAISSVVGVTAAISSTNQTTATPDFALATTQPDDEICDNQKPTEHIAPCPPIEGMWKSTTNDGASIEIKNLDDYNADIVIELHNQNYTKIDTAEFPVTFKTDCSTGVITATADFEYTDSFGSYGTGRLVFDGYYMHLELNEEHTGGYSLTPAAGEFELAW